MKILGTKYKIKYVKSNGMNDSLNYGETDRHSKEIRINTELIKNDSQPYNYDKVLHQIERHEVFHAIFHEVGLDCYSEDETLVDCLAILYPKIEKIMNKLES